MKPVSRPSESLNPHKSTPHMKSPTPRQRKTKEAGLIVSDAKRWLDEYLSERKHEFSVEPLPTPVAPSTHIVGGIKLDRPIYDGKAHWLANVGFRHYFDTDDLHPADKVDFTFADLKTAVVFAPVCEYFVPVLELTYLGDFDYSDLELQP